LLNDVAEYLVDGGWFMVEHGFDQALAVRALFEHALLLDVVTLRDLAGHERVTIGRKALDAH
jgi:release factor glutamine methyltransferase